MKKGRKAHFGLAALKAAKLTFGPASLAAWYGNSITTPGGTLAWNYSLYSTPGIPQHPNGQKQIENWLNEIGAIIRENNLARMREILAFMEAKARQKEGAAHPVFSRVLYYFHICRNMPVHNEAAKKEAIRRWPSLKEAYLRGPHDPTPKEIVRYLTEVMKPEKAPDVGTVGDYLRAAGVRFRKGRES